MERNDFDTAHLSGDAKTIAEAIVTLITTRKDGEQPYGGGCKAFYTPAEWKARGERYGRQSTLVLVHDGGDLASYVNYDYGDYASIDALNATLKSIGFYVEPCTGWYAAVYPL